MGSYLSTSHDADAVKLAGNASSVIVPKSSLILRPPDNLVDVRFGHQDRLVVAQVQFSPP